MLALKAKVGDMLSVRCRETGDVIAEIILVGTGARSARVAIDAPERIRVQRVPLPPPPRSTETSASSA